MTNQIKIKLEKVIHVLNSKSEKTFPASNFSIKFPNIQRTLEPFQSIKTDIKEESNTNGESKVD